MKKMLQRVLFLGLSLVAFHTAHAQYCSGGPQYTYDTEIKDVILEGDSYGISNLNTCPGQAGVVNYTTTDSADVTIGSTYCMTVNFGTCGGSYTAAGEVWIDWNNDSTFQSTESIGTWFGLPEQTVTYSFTVPSGAVAGNTVMRVMMHESGTLPLNPCATYGYGAVEDYLIHVNGTAPACVKPRCLAVASVGADNASISWQGSSSSYNYEYGPVGFTLGSGTTGTTSTNSASLTALTTNTEYDFYVQADCGSGVTSPWSSVATFRTTCPTVDVFPFSEDFDGSPWVSGQGSQNINDTLDPCWIKDPIVGYRWGVRTSQSWSISTGPNTDFSGSGNYLFTEASTGSTGDSAFINLPAFVLDSLTIPYVTFKYHMFGSTMGSMALQADTGTGWMTLWSISGQQQASGGTPWLDAQVDASSARSGNTQIRFVGVKGGTNSDMAIDNIVVSEVPPCLLPGVPVIGTVTDASAVVSWTSNGTNFVLEYGTPGFTPGTGAGTIVNVAGTSTTISGLASNTEFEVYIQQDCSSSANGYSAFVGPVAFKTLCTGSIVFSDNFDNNASSVVPECFSSITGTAGYVTTQTSSSAYSSPIRVRIYNSSNTSTTTALVSPHHPNLDQDTMQIRFQGMVSSSGMPFYIGTLRDNMSDTSLVIHDTINPSISYTWNQYITELDNVPAGHQFVAIVHPKSPSYTYVFVDDYNYEPIPSCTAPTSLGFISSTTNSANIYWTPGGIASWSQIEWGVKPHVQGTGSKMSVNNDSTTISGLSPNTTYQVWVRDSCGPNDVSPWFGPIEFTTACLSQSMPYTQDFENWPVACWNQLGTWDWVKYTSGGNSWAEASFYSQSSGYGVFLSPTISISQSAWVKFDYSHRLMTAYPDDELLVLGRIAGSTQWDTLQIFKGAGNFDTPGALSYAPSTTPDQATVYLPTSYTGNDVEFALWANTDYGPDVFVDNFEVSATPNCVAPANFATDSVDGYSVGISWFTPSTTVQYNVEWGLQGYTQGTGAWIGRDTVTNPDVFIQSLIPTTCYDIYVQSDCGNGTKSAYVKYGICTTVSCPAPSNTTLQNVSTNYATLGWTKGSSNDFNYVVGPAGTTPGTGTIVFGITSNPVTIFNLQPGTNYDFYVRDSCGPGDVSAWEGPFNFTTNCVPTNMNYSEPFAGNWTANGEVICWNMTGGSKSWEEDATTGSAMAKFWNHSAGNDLQMTSPVINVLQNARFRFKWSHKYNTFYPDDSLAIMVKDTAQGSTWNVIWAKGGADLESNDGAVGWAAGSFVEDTIVLSTSYTGSAVQFRFYGYSGWGGNLYVDDVTLEADPSTVSCPSPSGLTTGTTTASTASVGWVGGSGPWEVSYSPTPYNAIAATKVLATTNPVTLTNLSSNTPYSYVVREICSAGDTSLWSFQSNFRTNCANSFNLPYYEDYNSWLNPTSATCWDMTGGAQSWQSHQGTAAVASFFNWTAGNDAKMTSPVLNIASTSMMRFKWSHSANPLYPGDSLTVLVRDTTAGSSWIPVWQAGGANLESNDGASTFNPGSYTTDTIILDPSVLGQYVEVQFHAVSGWGRNLWIDSLMVESNSACGTPINLTANSLGCDSIEFGWSPVSGAVYSWVEYGSTGFTPGTGTMMANATNPIVINGLTPGTSYDFYVQDSCAAGRSTMVSTTIMTNSGPLPVINYIANQTSTTMSQATVSFDASGTMNGTTYTWDFGGSTQSGSVVNQVYTTNGAKTVTLTVTNGCGSVDSTFTFNVEHIGIEESAIGRSFNVFPNPTQGQFTIAFEVEQPLDVTLQIVDYLGRVIIHRDLGTIREKADLPIDLSNVAQGVYIIRLETDKGTLHKRITVTR